LESVESPKDDFEIEQADIVRTIKEKERRTESVGGAKFRWNKFNGDLACRVVKQFLKKHLPHYVKVVGPNAYIEGYPSEFDLLLVAESAIPAAFTNAYCEDEVRFVIEIKSHGYMDREFPSRLLEEFEALQEHYKNVKCTYLTIRETWNPKREGSISYVRELKKVLEPKYQVFCLAESRTHEIIPGQWRQFINYVTQLDTPNES
jgi:hypothetical protein